MVFFRYHTFDISHHIAVIYRYLNSALTAQKFRWHLEEHCANEKIFYVSALLRGKATFEWLNQNRNGKTSRYGGTFHLFSPESTIKKPAKMVVDCSYLSNSQNRYIEIYFDICDMISAHTISQFVIFYRYRYFDMIFSAYHIPVIWYITAIYRYTISLPALSVADPSSRSNVVLLCWSAMWKN